MIQLTNEIDKLDLDKLDEDWTNGIYHSEFLEIPELPSDYESECDVNKTFKKIIKAIDSWLSDEETEEEKTWATLSKDVNYRKVLSLLGFYIDNGKKNVHTKEYRDNALLASRLYYKLLSIPGYKVYQIYHSQLFTHSLGCLSFPREMCVNDDQYYNVKDLTREVNHVIKQLQGFATSLQHVIVKLQLQPTDMNFEEILSSLMDITSGAIVNRLNIDRLELANISRIIYEMIDILLRDVNGEPSAVAIGLLFKSLLPKLVVASSDCKNSNNIVRASYVTYTGLLISKYEKPALTGFKILLEHLCYAQDGLERAEVRAGRVSLIVGLMSLLPRKSYRRTIHWIMKLSTTSKVSHRHISLEILAKLLDNEPEENEPEAVPPVTETPKDQQDSTTEISQENVKEQNISEENKTEGDTAKPAIGDDESSQASSNPVQEVEEEETSALLSARLHLVPRKAIVHQVLQRVNDTSSTIRSRALQILAHVCCATQNVEDFGTSVESMLSLAARCAGDERAVVRKTALLLLQKLIAVHHSETGLAVLVNLCRDASVLVRSSAISSLGELALANKEGSVDAFLAGALHQLSDPESKIQDQVISFVQQMVFDRIRKYSDGGVEDQLPWLFLAAITKHNMRRHLQKVCSLLAKAGNNNCASIRTVDILSTHLSSESSDRQLHALTLLTSVARHVDYSDVKFVLDFYYRITEDGRGSDGRLLALTLQLLMEWSQWIVGPSRSDLRTHLVHRLTEGKEGCRIEMGLLASHLEPTNLHWATELMHIYERRALSSDFPESVEWSICLADASLVAPVPPNGETTKMLINLLQNTPEDPEASSIPRGLAVTALGRLCVRSRSTASTAAPIFANILSNKDEHSTPRLNSLLALADIAARYTCIVEPLLITISECLEKDCPLELRRATARALTRLFLGAYLRLRTPLYYTFCALLADPEADVREPAEYYVTSCLGADTIFQHIVDCILHYNEDVSENLSFDDRQLIYDVMLQRLSLVQKLNVQCRLAREIIGHAANQCEDGYELSEALQSALMDTITLLCGPRMKLPRKPQNTTGDADLDEIQERVTTNIVSHKMKRTVAEVLIPSVLRLYAHMRSQGGQLVVYIVRLATDLLKDYKQEIEELIENDEDLVVAVRQFQETIGEEPSFGNRRNLLIASAPPEPDTPKGRKRVRPSRGSPKKRAIQL